MTVQEIYDAMTPDQRARPFTLAYPNFNADVPVVTEDVEWNATLGRLEADTDNWSG